MAKTDKQKKAEAKKAEAKQTEVKETKPVEESIAKEEGQMFTREQVLELLREAQNRQEEQEEQDQTIERGSMIGVNRFNGKWVVGFADRNQDEYRSDSIYSIVKKDDNGVLREHIVLVLKDKDKLVQKEVSIKNYIEGKQLIYLKKVDVKEIDRSKKYGKIEETVYNGKDYIKTNRMIDQKVTVTDKIYTVELSDGELLEVSQEAIG